MVNLQSSRRWSSMGWIGVGAVMLVCTLLFYSPLRVHRRSDLRISTPDGRPLWLLGIMSPAPNQRRRNIIRATLLKTYSNPAWTFRFVISNPGDLWMPLVQHENATYGDLVMLDHLEENAHIANTIKTVEWLKSVVNSGESYTFLSKVDDDSFLAATDFYRQYLSPLVGTELDANLLIGRTLQGDRPHTYAAGQFYTLSWATAAAVARQQEKSPVLDEHEDVLIGRLLYEAGEPFEITQLDVNQAFDYDPDVGDPWAWYHNVTEESINPHRLKDDELYLTVAAQVIAWHPPS